MAAPGGITILTVIRLYKHLLRGGNAADACLARLFPLLYHLLLSVILVGFFLV